MNNLVLGDTHDKMNLFFDNKMKISSKEDIFCSDKIKIKDVSKIATLIMF